jgi:hypothetical protein
LARTGVRSLNRVGSDPESTLLIGSLKHTDGRRAVLLVNHNMAYTAWPTVVFDSEGEVVEIGREDGREHLVLDDSPELPGTQLSFGAGDARLFLLPPERK